jgi:hypothetical protein
VIEDAFLDLTQSLENLGEGIRQDVDKVVWVQSVPVIPSAVAPRETVIRILNQLFYLPEQLPREILVCAGFVGASQETLALAQKVNECKAVFKQRMIDVKAEKLSVNELLMRSPATAAVLKKAGLSRLHLKQCYRKIPILKEAPSKISWTWAHTRSIKRISLQTAQNMLLKRGEDEGIQIQLRKLGTLQPNESLAIVQELAPHLRANIVFSRPESNERMMIKGPIPIFFPAEPSTSAPHYSVPVAKQEKDTSRMIRSDVKLDPEVFLPAIRGHRYLKQTVSNTDQ